MLNIGAILKNCKISYSDMPIVKLTNDNLTNELNSNQSVISQVRIFV